MNYGTYIREMDYGELIRELGQLERERHSVESRRKDVMEELDNREERVDR